MQYISTRGQTPPRDFVQVMLEGLAPDGGLYVPAEWPQLSRRQIAELRGLSYVDAACRVMKPFLGGAIDDAAFRALAADAYAQFDHPQVAPVVELDGRRHLLELFHGPTLAFKDIALQLLGRLYDHVLTERDETVTLIGATSGDTGSAAIAAVQGRQRATIFIMHPRGRVSDVQRRQMTTVDAANVHNVAIEGTFDDCQAIVKAMFNDPAFRSAVRMAAVNSINWARVMAQVVYYFTAAVALGAPDRPVAFSVPTGNFGDIFAGYVAAKMGLPVERLIIATNVNDILTRVMNSGRHKLGQVHPTMSPAMDIQVSSNFERLLFDMYGRDGQAVRGLMQQLAKSGSFDVAPAALDVARELFSAQRVDEQRTLETIAKVHRDTGRLIDPHTAVGLAAAEQEDVGQDVPMVVLGTADPAKFPEAVEKATGRRPPLPPALADLYDRPERCEVMPNDLAAVTAHIRRTLDL